LDKEIDHKERILVADDEPATISMIQQSLEHEGYIVKLARNGEEIFQALSTFNPDLILLDVVMPKMDGYEVCRKIKQNESLKHIPILILTVLDRREDCIKGLNAGADDFISKSIDRSEMMARIKAFLRSKKLHDELEESYHKLKELEELRDSLVSMIVHDLKAPLLVIYGGIQIALEDLPKTDQHLMDVLKFLTNAEQSCKQLTSLIDNILDTNKLEQHQIPLIKNRVDLKKLVMACLSDSEYVMKKSKINSELQANGENLLVLSDEVVIRRVIANLLSNSIKFTPVNGKITIFLSSIPEDNQVECCVFDTGKGIPQRYIDKVFDKFFQGDNPEVIWKGQGLGLAFCRMAIESHGGKIWVESEEGKGSIFKFRLPAA